MNIESMNIHDIMDFLPHRYPFLLIDRILELQEGATVLALKNVTINEPFFSGHFPQRPVMPGVLIIEALAQAAGILAYATTYKSSEGLLFYLAGVDNVRFKRVVEPGDQLMLRVDIERARKGVTKFNCVAHVGDELACRANILTAKKDPD